MKCVNINVVEEETPEKPAEFAPEKPAEFEFEDFLPLIAVAGALAIAYYIRNR